MKALLGKLSGLFGTNNALSKVIRETKELGDEWFTSDEERQAFHIKMELIASLSNNPLARTGRAAIMWALAITGIYNWVIRDIAAVFMGVEIPDAPIDPAELLEHLVGIIAGTL